MRLRVFLTPLVLLLMVAPAMGQGALPVKQVVAPASDIQSGLLKLPDLAEQGVMSRSLLYEIRPNGQGVEAIDLDPVFGLGERGGRVVFLPAEPGACIGRVQANDGRAMMTNQGGAVRGLEKTKHALPWGDARAVYDSIALRDNAGGGFRVGIELVRPVGGYVLLTTNPDAGLYTYVETRRTLVSKPITLVSSVSDGSPILNMTGFIRSPSGKRTAIDAQPGSDRVEFTPTEVGSYAVRVQGAYLDANGQRVTLSTQHVIEVEEPAVELGAVSSQLLDDRLVLRFDEDETNRRVILAGEVWGRSGDDMVPVCWLSRVCDGDRSLAIDLRWIALAGVDPQTLELRQVRVHDVDSFVPLEVVDRIAFQTPAMQLPQAPAAVTPDMLVAKAPVMVDGPEGIGASSSRGVLPGGHRLLLVHGYCSGGNPFTTSHFSGDIAVFNDPNVSRSHDAFALQILSQAAPMKSFGVAAHSQGAMAAVHLYTFYFSGLDWARGDRLIQTVGAPWQGTPLAGNAAVLGDIFGFGCGENNDLSYTGSANWLSMIPTSSRQMVWYYTTSFEDRAFVYDYCNIITDLLLSDPDDGVIERSRGQLSGATNMGHVEGWCHTTGMRDPAQCTDTSRNAIINARARR